MEVMAKPRESPQTPAAHVAAAFQAYAPRLHAYVLKRLRRRADAADLTQEIFERFLRIDRLERVRQPLHYLFGIAANVVSDAQLARQKSPLTYDSEALPSLAARSSDGSVADPADRLGLAQELESALALLPDTHRAVLLLVKRDGLSYEEAARALDLKVSTVTSYVFEARARMKQILTHRGA
jgi:RNA polymerase sigma factor (sigma-70 family)